MVELSKESQPETKENETHLTKADRRSLNRKTTIAIAVSVIVSLLIGAVVIALVLFQPKAQNIANFDDGNKIQEFSNEANISDVASRVSPSIVSIVTSGTSMSYFGVQEVQGAGTGIIISKDGYVLTNKHVVDGVDKAEIVLSDGTTYEDVKIVGKDPLNDVAFLKIEGVSDLKPAELGNSSTVKVGQQVIAIGNSLGQYQNTVTSGIISGIGRPVEASTGGGSGVESLHDLLQTDAAINPGNSGGPLLNAKGQVIGINTAIVENAQSLGFSIPINSTKGLIKGLLLNGKVKRAYLGVRYVAVTPDIAKRNKLSSSSGAYITASGSSRPVVSGGPADKAGIQSGDIITKVGDISVGSSGDLMTLTGMYMPGEKIEMTILRGDKEIKVTVELGEYS